jgi:hypothetical protein
MNMMSISFYLGMEGQDRGSKLVSARTWNVANATSKADASSCGLVVYTENYGYHS